MATTVAFRALAPRLDALTGPERQLLAQWLDRVIDALEAIAAETGKSVPQIAINWLLRRPTVA